MSTFLAVQRSAFGENWRQRGNVLKPTLVLRDGASETEVNVDALLRGEASVVEAALDDSVRFWIEYIPAPPEPRRGDVVELEPWSHHGAVVPHNNDGLDFTVDACADGLVRIAWVERPAAMSDDDTPWQCNVTLPRPAVRVARRDSWADTLARPAAALRGTEAGGASRPSHDVATALAPAAAAALAWRRWPRRRRRRAGHGAPGHYLVTLFCLDVRAPRTARATHCGSSS